MEDLRISEAAALAGVHENTIRNAIKQFEKTDGDKGLRATLKPGQYGKKQYAIHPKVFAAWVLERYGRQLSDEELTVKSAEESPAAADSAQVTELYERLLAAQEEATRYKALEAGEEKVIDLLQTQLAEASLEVATLREALEKERGRSWLARLVGR